MTRRGLIIAGFIGLLFAIAETLLAPVTLNSTSQPFSLGVGVLGLLAAGLAGRALLGDRTVHRYFTAGVTLLAAISGFVFESAYSNWLISQDVEFGHPPTTLRSAVVIAIVIGAVVYLLAATVYGFAATRQGVGVRSRIALLLLLLLSVVPVLNILGLLGVVITAFRRRPVSPEPAPVSA
jgi:hypothetical protein